MQFRLKGDLEYLLLLAESLTQGTLDEPAFQAYVTQYVIDHPELVNVTWADADFVIRWTAPYEPDKQVIGLTLTLAEPERASRLAQETRQPVYTRPFEVIQGRPAFEFYVPVFREDEFLGTFGGVYSVDTLVQGVSTDLDIERYHLSLVDDSDAVLVQMPVMASFDEVLVKQVLIDPPGYGISLRLVRYQRMMKLWETLLLTFRFALTFGVGLSNWMLRRDLIGRQEAEAALQVAHDELEKRVWERTAELAEANTRLR